MHPVPPGKDTVECEVQLSGNKERGRVAQRSEIRPFGEGNEQAQLHDRAAGPDRRELCWAQYAKEPALTRGFRERFYDDRRARPGEYPTREREGRMLMSFYSRTLRAMCLFRECRTI
jgi:hypothetical protein